MVYGSTINSQLPTMQRRGGKNKQALEISEAVEETLPKDFNLVDSVGIQPPESYGQAGDPESPRSQSPSRVPQTLDDPGSSTKKVRCRCKPSTR